jgi:hypothetical protein
MTRLHSPANELAATHSRLPGSRGPTGPLPSHPVEDPWDPLHIETAPKVQRARASSLFGWALNLASQRPRAYIGMPIYMPSSPARIWSRRRRPRRAAGGHAEPQARQPPAASRSGGGWGVRGSSGLDQQVPPTCVVAPAIRINVNWALFLSFSLSLFLSVSLSLCLSVSLSRSWAGCWANFSFL